MTDQDKWTAVDRYITDLLVPTDGALKDALRESASAGLPDHHVTPAQGKLLFLLARVQRARAILEIGTLGGYSTIWLARALAPGGRLVTLESNPSNAEVARKNFAREGLSEYIDLRLGPALDALPTLLAEGRGPFDLVFLDADKPNNPHYLTWALRLSRPGTVIVADNVVRNGEVANPGNTDPSVQGIRRFNELLASEPRVQATTIQTVGSKGYDGFTLALVES